jgi:hypothetical protein
VTPVELDNEFQAIAQMRFERGFAKWHRGITKEEWPSHCDGQGAFTIGPPKFLSIQELEDHP